MYRKSIESSLQELGSSPQGLSSQEAAERIKSHGANEIGEQKKTSVLLTFLKSFKDVMILVLLFAAVLSAVLEEYTDSILILAIILINAIIGTVQEVKAMKAVSSLQTLTATRCIAIRDGVKVEIDAKELVPGDIVILETGNIIPADGRLIQAVNLQVNESNLTGENLPVEKDETYETLENIPIGDRKNLVYSSTVVTHGRGEFVVTHTGMATEIGKIAFMVISHEDDKTPLQKKLDNVGKVLATLVVVLAIGIFVLGVLQSRGMTEMFFTAITIAVAAIPEGLPTVVSIVLALGISRLAKKSAIVKGLSSVETLGSASVICTDKTGTLTMNEMSVEKVSQDADIHELAKGMMLCNDAEFSQDKYIGDPTETALIAFGKEKGLSKEQLEAEAPRVMELAFDSTRKMMSTLHKVGDKYIQYTKGASDVIIPKSDKIFTEGQAREFTQEHKKALEEENLTFSKEAMRVLSLARKEYDQMPESLSEEGLTYVGAYAMMDPPRQTVRESITQCKTAGIVPVMITGDHLSTAMAIGKKIGLFDEEHHMAITGVELEQFSDEELDEKVENIRIYARVSPEQKVRIVNAWQKKDQIVAMTGDGVNDAPALKTADIGVAMGNMGTDVSREAADMILVDDNFSTIVSAVREGRTIFDNIKRTVRYLLSCNFGEVIAILVAMILQMPIPLTPLHILWINLISDGMPAVALGFEPEDSNVMEKPPRKKSEGIFTKRNLSLLFFEGLLIGGLAFAAFYLGYQGNPEYLVRGRTMAFLTLAFAQLVQGANVRSEGSLFKKGLLGNKYYLFTFVFSIALQLALVFIPQVASLFSLQPLDSTQWLYVAGLSIMPLIVTEIRKVIVKG